MKVLNLCPRPSHTVTNMNVYIFSGGSETQGEAQLWYQWSLKLPGQELILEWDWGPWYPLSKAPAYITALEPGIPEDMSQHLDPKIAEATSGVSGSRL